MEVVSDDLAERPTQSAEPFPALKVMAAMATSDAAALITATDSASNVVRRWPLVEGGGPGSRKHRAAVESERALSAADGLKLKESGRKPLPDLFYATQARIYVEALGTGSPIAELGTRSGYSQSRARNHVAKARALGLLTPTPQGRAGGQLTPLAIRILDGADQ